MQIAEQSAYGRIVHSTCRSRKQMAPGKGRYWEVIDLWLICFFSFDTIIKLTNYYTMPVWFL
jgi:hypothetical protein